MRPKPYNYQSLDELLHTCTDPKEVGEILDKSMFDYIRVMSVDGNHVDENHYGLLRQLRDVFANLNQ